MAAKKKTAAAAKKETVKAEVRKSPGKSLVVVESPAKARTIVKYLGPKFIVKASIGHIKDLPKKSLAVNIKRGFEPTYEVIPTKKKVIAELKAAAQKADVIYLAADPDREGEAICQHLAEELSNGKKILRIRFQEITKTAVQEAVANPTSIDGNMVEAQQARRILDRLVGYKVSPLLWDKVRRGLSAGRVQTVALRLIVEREREIKAFVTREYWTMDALLGAKLPPQFDARLVKKNDEAIEISNGEQSAAIEKELSTLPFVVAGVATKEKRRNPTPPFITSKLQQDASRKLHFSVKRTMVIAQRLYEGLELGDEGSVGLITYMRSDSTRVAEHALTEVREFIGSEYGGSYLPEKANVYKTKKDAQDAHEAIRPRSRCATRKRGKKIWGKMKINPNPPSCTA